MKAKKNRIKKEEIIPIEINHESEISRLAEYLSDHFSITTAESIELAIEMHESDILFRGLIPDSNDPVALESIAIAGGILDAFPKFSQMNYHTYKKLLDVHELFKETKEYLNKYSGKLTEAQALRSAIGIRKAKILSAGLSVVDKAGLMPSALQAIAISAGYRQSRIWCLE